MHPRRPGPLAAAAAAVGAGALFGLAIQVSTDVFASGPLAVAGAAAVATCAVALAPRGRWRAWAAAAIAGGALLYAERVGHAIVGVLGWGLGVPVVATAAAIAGMAMAAPLRPAIAECGVVATWIAAGWIFSAAWLPREALIAVVLAAGAVVAAVRPARARPRYRPRGNAFVAAGVLVPLVGAWACLRGGLDPTPLGALALVAGAVAGGAARSRAAGLLGILFAAGVTGWALRAPADVAAMDPRAGALVFAAMGLGAGASLGAATNPRAVAIATVLTALAVPALRWLPPGWAAKAARAHAATVRDRARMEDVRSRAKVTWAGVGPAGASALRQLGDDTLAELDGAPADPASRAGEAERFAGTLAACATEGRAHARVGGDDLGLALEALRAQGFALVDTAVPDRDLVRAQAAARPALERLWLHPAVRLVAVASPTLLRLGEDADAVVEIARTPWTDGRVRFPDARGLRATKATLSPGGVHVLALGGTALSRADFEGVLRAFADTYPTASVWLPPSGADTAVLVGHAEAGARIPWRAMEACVAADAEALARMSLRSASDVAGLALADGPVLRALAPAEHAPGIPREAREAPALHLARFAETALDPAAVFADDAPLAELRERGEARAGFLRMLATSTTGDTAKTIEAARRLSDTPGGGRALEPLVRPHLARARTAIAQGRREGPTSKAWDVAEDAIATARLLHPSFAETRCLEGDLALGRGQLPRAEDAYAACGQLDAASDDAWKGLAFVRLQRKNYTGAEEALRADLAAHPDRWDVSLRLGVFLMDLGRLDEAEPLLRKAAAGSAREGATQPEPHLALARLYLKRDRPDAALLESQTAMEATRSADALALHGAARVALHQLDAAERDLRAALEEDPRNAFARGELGHVQALRGDYELAAASFRAVLEVEPGNAAARQNLEKLGPLLREKQE